MSSYEKLTMRYYLLNLYLGRVAIALIADALCFGAAAALTWYILAPAVSSSVYTAGFAMGAFGAFATLYYTGAYSLTVLGSGRKTLRALLTSMGLTSGIALAAYFALDPHPGVIAAMAHTAGLYFPLLFGGRFLFRRISALPRYSQRVLVIGTSDLGIAIAEAVRERPNLGNDLVGFLSDELLDEGGTAAGYPVLGKVHEIEKIVDPLKIGRIVVASKSRAEYFPAEELLAAKLRGRRVESGVSFYERVTGRIYLRDLRSSYLIFSDGFSSRRPLSEALKRGLDAAVAGIGLLVVSPIMAITALVIRLESKGPIFFKQERVGRSGARFTMFKLRTMLADSPKYALHPDHAHDNRVTTVGRWLRRLSIDELPQLWNVVRGEMSLVGPRPEMPFVVKRYDEAQRQRLAVKPGATGLWQVSADRAFSIHENMQYDLYYVGKCSLTLDLAILLMTPFALLARNRAV